MIDNLVIVSYWGEVKGKEKARRGEGEGGSGTRLTAHNETTRGVSITNHTRSLIVSLNEWLVRAYNPGLPIGWHDPLQPFCSVR